MAYKDRWARAEVGGSFQGRGLADDQRQRGGSLGGAPDFFSPELIVFACTDDLGLAQIAATWFPMLADPRKARAVLAGRGAIARIEPEILAALRERVQDVKPMPLRELSSDLLAASDLVVTIGQSFERRVLDPTIPVHREHWLIPDRENGSALDNARSLCDLIRSRVAMLVFSEGWDRADVSREIGRVTRSRRTAEMFATS